MKRARVIRPRQEALPPKHEQEHFEEMLAALAFFMGEQVGCYAGHAEDDRKIEFQEMLGLRFCVLPVEAPLASVGQNSPFDSMAGLNVGAVEIGENLR